MAYWVEREKSSWRERHIQYEKKRNKEKKNIEKEISLADDGRDAKLLYVYIDVVVFYAVSIVLRSAFEDFRRFTTIQSMGIGSRARFFNLFLFRYMILFYFFHEEIKR